MLNNISLSIITSDVVDNSVDLVLPDAAILTVLNNISRSIITSDVVDGSVDLVLPRAVIVTVTDDERVENRERHKHEHTESPQSRSWTHGIQVLHGAIKVRVTILFLVGGVRMEHTLIDATNLAVVIACLHCDCCLSRGGGRGGHGLRYAHDNQNDGWGMRRRWRGA